MFDIGPNYYGAIQDIFKSPIMIAIYTIGIVSISAHLGHSLMNVKQTLGISSNQSKIPVLIIVGIITLISLAIPITVA